MGSIEPEPPEWPHTGIGDIEYPDGIGPTAPPHAVKGEVWDIKQTRSGKKSAIAVNRHKQLSLLRDIFKPSPCRWDLLRPYYRSEALLYDTHWYHPIAKAPYACILYQVGAIGKPTNQWECRPHGIICRYYGKLTAPASGSYRFIGSAYDYIHVCMNGQTVLEAGSIIPALYDGKHEVSCILRNHREKQKHFLNIRPHYRYVSGNTAAFDACGGPVAGKVFTVQQDETVELDIVIVSLNSDRFGYVLYIAEEHDIPQPPLPLFRTYAVQPDADTMLQKIQESGYITPESSKIPFSDDSYIWETAGTNEPR